MEENVEVERTSEATLSKYLFFGLPRISSSVVLTVVDFAIIFLYFEGYGLNPILVGISTMCGKFAIAISQFTMGYLSDTVKSERFGKRKPFMLIGAPLLGISFSMLLLPTLFLGSIPAEVSLFMWLLMFDVLFQFFYGVLTTPYQSWMAEQFEVHERPNAAAWQNIYNYLGTAIAFLFTLIIIPSTLEDFETTKQINPIFTLFVILFALLSIALFYVTAIVLPVESAPPIKMDIINDLKEITKDRNYLHVCVMIGIASLTWSMITGIMLGYVQNVLRLTNMIYGAGGLAIGVVCSLFIWKKVIDKLGKKKALTAIFLWAICSIPFAGIVPLFPFEDFTVPALVLVIIISASLGGWFLFPYMLYADLAENNQKTSKDKELKAGLYTGFPSILLNLFQAFGLLFTGFLLALPNVPGTDYTAGYLIWAPIGAGILIIALLYTRRFITLDFDWEK